MQWFVNLPTKAKLFVSFGIMIGFLAVVVFTAQRNITRVQETQAEIFNHEFNNSVDSLRLKSSVDEVRLSLVMMLVSGDSSARETYHQTVKDKTGEIDKTMHNLLERNRKEPAILAKLEELNSVLSAFKLTRDGSLIPLIYAGRVDKAKSLMSGVQAQRYERMRQITTELSMEAVENARGHMTESISMVKTTTSMFMGLGIAAIAVSFGIAIFLNRIIAVPLREISDVAARISSGDLTVTTPATSRSDEVGALYRSFGTMVDKLQTQTKNLLEAVNVLASSSNEIAATTAQLASGAEETAVAVTETTTTVEEVKQTANVSTQKARHVVDLAQNAVEVSRTGARLVNETLDGVGRIREQMEYIAETIVKLSEHNQAIGEIIATVDDLSEQSNILAVNASIEASKAGEFGKGFIIVAQEIKSLAEQSKQATRQVRSILNDIQKSSTAAVMATEKGTKAVEATVSQSAGTGDSIQELSKSITDASQAVTQIAASSQQQLVGMDQVAIAMASIKQASAQNATSTKQVEMTVRNLNEVGLRLKSLIENYRV